MMSTSSILFILIAIGIASGVSFYQYLYKAKTDAKWHWFLAFLRFLTIFGILLLLLNPRIQSKSYETVKTPLPIVLDNSSSIKELNAEVVAKQAFEKLISDPVLQEKFEIYPYIFDEELKSENQFDFKGKQTNIDAVAKGIKNFFKNAHFPTVLLTDGNQTKGNEFIFSFPENNAVLPLILGDTTTVLDLKVNQLNVNRYAFLKNKFPVEVFLQYNGNKKINAQLTILQGNSVIAKEALSFTSQEKSKVVSLLLPAEKVGVQVFKAVVSTSESEKNSYNNTKNFAVEVIDQKSEIAIVSAINHPDVGMLKRAIETNQQRKVSIVKPNQIGALQDYNLLILYQPTADFKPIFEKNTIAQLNMFIITGTATDFTFLNQNQPVYEYKVSSQKEEYSASFSPQFNLFALENIGFENLPPLQHPFGSYTAKEKVEVALNSTIRNIATNQSMLTYAELHGKRWCFLMGENIWKWRLQSHITKQSFDEFDVFIDKTIQFLVSNDRKKNLVVTHDNFYNSGDAIEVNAQFFNRNYEFDENARLNVTVVNKKTKASKKYDLLKGTNSFKVNLDGLAAGDYSVTVREQNSNSVYNGSFEVLDFDIEKQFVNPDVKKLEQLALFTQGKLFYSNQIDALVDYLKNDESYTSVQKEVVKKTPIIDWMWLLLLVTLTLTLEWFIRKYNGLL
jgi:hypothetical protein